MFRFALIFLVAATNFFDPHGYLLSAAHAQRLQPEFTVQQVATGLKFPWGMAFLPDGNILVTERIGQLRIISANGQISDPIQGVPEVFFKQQGGLLDVALDPEFSKNRLIYLSYAEPEDHKASTAVARAELIHGQLKNLQVIFRQLPKTADGIHFGSRLAFARDGNLFITLGDRGSRARLACLGRKVG